MFEEVVSLENLFAAWHEFQTGKRNRADVQEFEFTLEDNLFQLREELLNRSYVHGPYHPFYVTDPKLRHIHKATVRDRVLHHALFRVLSPIFDRAFIFDSYSCRVSKGTHRGIQRLVQFAQKVSKNNSRNVFALKCDVRKFFDSVNHDILLKLTKRRVADQDVIWLLERVLGSYSVSEKCGLPLGNVTSQLLANVYLNELDYFAKHVLRLRYYLRYCDDFIILSSDKEQPTLLVQTFADFLESTLELTLHPNKIVVRTFRQGIDFLGYVVRPYCRTLRTKTRNRLLRDVSHSVSEHSLQSYLGVLKHCNGYGMVKKINEQLGKNKRLILGECF